MRQPQSESESSDDDNEIAEWPTSPPEVRETAPNLDSPPRSSPAASSSPLRPHDSDSGSDSPSRQPSESPVPQSSRLPAEIEESDNKFAEAVINGDGLTGDGTDDGELSIDDRSTVSPDPDTATRSEDGASQPAVEGRPMSGSESESEYESAPEDKAESDDEADVKQRTPAPVKAEAADELSARQDARKQAYSGARSESVKETLGSGDKQATPRRRITRSMNRIIKPRKFDKPQVRPYFYPCRGGSTNL